MYDVDKLNAYWRKREEVWATWRRNGWSGDFQDFGRYFTFTCGHQNFAAWGISDDDLKVRNNCWDCGWRKSLDDTQRG